MQSERKMAETLKFVYTMMLFVSLFFHCNHGMDSPIPIDESECINDLDCIHICATMHDCRNCQPVCHNGKCMGRVRIPRVEE
ncbi:unnamed protein product [Trifolium pratense]|uniref:Uncharacterized protein n=1 Tax=Trifolium pratense TaxID=57577 RepID=A0ACB0LM33_TRIPR|nr:unnamed protein product [Trifolium pratense]